MRQLFLHHHPIPSLARNTRWRGLSLHHYLSHSKCEMKGVVSPPPPPYSLPRSKRETVVQVSPSPLYPLTQNARRRGVLSPPPPYSLPRSKCETEGVVSPPPPPYSLPRSKCETEGFHHHHHGGVPPPPPPHSTREMEGFHHYHPSLASNAKWRG